MARRKFRPNANALQLLEQIETKPLVFEADTFIEELGNDLIKTLDGGLLTIEQVADVLGCSTRHVHRLTAAKKLRRNLIGGASRYGKGTIRSFLQQAA